MARRGGRGESRTVHPINPASPGHPPGEPWPQYPAAIDDGGEYVPHYVDGPRPLSFASVTAGVFPANPLLNPAYGSLTNVTTRAIWQSPVFDLRPDLKSDNYRPTGVEVPGMGRLMVAINLQGPPSGNPQPLLANLRPLITTIASTLEVYSLEAGHMLNPRLVAFFERRKDITTDFFDATEQSILEWAPAGAPIRYWRTTIIFDWTGVAGTEPTLEAWSGAY